MSGISHFKSMTAPQRDAVFLTIAAVAVLFKLALVSDLSVTINYFPHDDSLYVERAYYLLRGEGFGPYDSRTLIKYPGLSIWLAGMRSLGIPYIFSVQVLYAAAGLYFVFGLMRSGCSRWVALLAFALYLFNPITLGAWWMRVLREPLATGLFVLMLAGWLHFLTSIEQGRPRIGHGILAAVTFGFALYVREDDPLLWALLVMVAALFAWRVILPGASFSRKRAYTLPVVILGLHMAAGWYVGYGVRQFVENHYGLPMIQDFSEGEFPKLMAAIRAIRSDKDNRMVMVTNDVLRRLSVEVPAFAPVVDRLPPPGPVTPSCRLHGVCSEWSNGWMLYWIKDAAYAAGLTPDLPSAQKYFKSVRESIEQACSAGRFSCETKGEKLIPPMELRWTRAYLTEWTRLLKFAISPDPSITLYPAVRFSVSAELGRRYQAVTMTDYFDTEWQTSFVQTPQQRLFVNPLAGWRQSIGKMYATFAPLLIIGLALSLLVIAARRPPSDAGAAVCAFAMAFLLFRTLALAYVAVFMGAFDSRMMLTTYAVATLLAVPLLAGAFAVRRPKTAL